MIDRKNRMEHIIVRMVRMVKMIFDQNSRKSSGCRSIWTGEDSPGQDGSHPTLKQHRNGRSVGKMLNESRLPLFSDGASTRTATTTAHVRSTVAALIAPFKIYILVHLNLVH